MQECWPVWHIIGTDRRVRRGCSSSQCTGPVHLSSHRFCHRWMSCEWEESGKKTMNKITSLWYDMIEYDIWYNMIWYNMIWYNMIQYNMIWYIRVITFFFESIYLLVRSENTSVLTLQDNLISYSQLIEHASYAVISLLYQNHPSFMTLKTSCDHLGTFLIYIYFN